MAENNTRKAAKVAPNSILTEASHLKGEYQLLQQRRPHYAKRVAALSISEEERAFVSYAVNKEEKVRRMGKHWAIIGNRHHVAQVVCGALVPVLIGISGSFENVQVDVIVRIVAIVFSIFGTVCHAVESVYNYRERGQTRKGYSDRMNGLFNSYCNLTGPIFDLTYRHPGDSGNIVIPNLSEVPLPILEAHVAGLKAAAVNETPATPRVHAGENFRKFCDEFNRLQEGCREAAFLGQRVQTE
jgi:hypothetical protein